jgi:hypothetical protein
MIKHSPEELRSDPATRITNRDMAEEMAWAGKPLQVLACKAVSLELNDKAAELRAEADEVEVSAGRLYIDGKRAELDEMTAQLEAGSKDNSASNTTESELPEPEKNDTWKLLTPEQRAKAKQEITRLAGEFNRDEAEFDLVQSRIVNELYELKDVFKIMHTATKGIDLGNPNKEFDPKRNWDGSLKKTRELELSGITLADAQALAMTNPEINEWVWLTGEKDRAVRYHAPVAYVAGSRAFRRMSDREDVSRVITFRPAVVIA